MSESKDSPWVVRNDDDWAGLPRVSSEDADFVTAQNDIQHSEQAKADGRATHREGFAAVLQEIEASAARFVPE